MEVKIGFKKKVIIDKFYFFDLFPAKGRRGAEARGKEKTTGNAGTNGERIGRCSRVEERNYDEERRSSDQLGR